MNLSFRKFYPTPSINFFFPGIAPTLYEILLQGIDPRLPGRKTLSSGISCQGIYSSSSGVRGIWSYLLLIRGIYRPSGASRGGGNFTSGNYQVYEFASPPGPPLRRGCLPPGPSHGGGNCLPPGPPGEAGTSVTWDFATLMNFSCNLYEFITVGIYPSGNSWSDKFIEGRRNSRLPWRPRMEDKFPESEIHRG